MYDPTANDLHSRARGIGRYFQTLKESFLPSALARKPRKFPTMTINPSVHDIDSFSIEDFELTGYDPYPPIKAPVAV